MANRLNQLSTVSGTVISYESNGNLSTDGVFTFEYDEENRLRSATAAASNSIYEYDPLGRRRSKAFNGALTKYVSEGVEELEERDAANSMTRAFVYGSGPDDRIAMIDASSCLGGGHCYNLYNWQGSVSTVVHQSGALAALFHYGPFGESSGWSTQDPLGGNPFRFNGRRLDTETGLYCFRSRYYSTRFGRFLQPDQIGGGDDLNIYAYVANDPLNRVDPFGMAGCANTLEKAKCATAKAAQENALRKVRGARAVLASLRAERSAVAAGTQPGLSPAAAATETLLGQFFKGSSDELIDVVDTVLEFTETVLADTGDQFLYRPVSDSRLASAFSEGKTAVAHPYLSESEIFLTERFFGTSNESRERTLAHEPPHLIRINAWPWHGQTEKYGDEAAQKLPMFEALNNADNYAGFVMRH